MQILTLLLLFLVILHMVPTYTFSQSGENRIQTQVEKKLAAGEKPNRLIKEKSPYLLQHAFNPVDWYPWGDEAFAKAREEDKPIFLSIGYSTCHWCHVMAHESFENNDIAAILNKWFISIKVDREERPDIDQMYMAATQAMTGSGGWPMSVFLLADGSPFYAGTYFPPVSIAGRPGFADLLSVLHKAWLEKREDIKSTADQLVDILQKSNLGAQSPIKKDVFEQGYQLFVKSYDSARGGFGKAPKFPRPVIFPFLFSHYLKSSNQNARDMALFTLRKMAAGGMYDQIGGGFHRYSVDENWFVPHFEKMLYDQAQLASAYLDAFVLTKEQSYAKVAKDIFNYLLRDLHDPDGGFYSAEDADSENPYDPGHAGEGAFYLWKHDDIVKRLGQTNGDIFIYHFGIKADGNVEQDPMNEFTGRNILYQAETLEKTAEKFKKSTSQISTILQDSKNLLFTARQQRKRSHLDDKIITAWNGMMIAALAKGSRALDDPKLLAEAIKTAGFLKEKLYNSSTQKLQRRYRSNEAGFAGQLADYTHLIDGLIELYQANHDPQWLSWSLALLEQQITLFWSEKDGYFFDSVADPSIKIRMRDGYEGAQPTGNSVAAHNLIRLAQLQDNTEWHTMARRLIESFSETINSYPPALPYMLTAWQHIDSKSTQVIIAGKREAQDTKALLQTVNEDFSMDRLLLLADGAENQQYLAQKLPFMESVLPQNGVATAYVCTNFTCKMPVTKKKELQKQLDELRK